MKKSTMITGYVAAFMMLAGIIFKVQHWPAASLLILLAGAVFSFAYAIPLFVEKLKVAQDSLAKFVAMWVLLIMIVLPVSFVFKVQHYPGAAIALIISHIILFISIPLLIVYAVKTKDVLKKLSFHNEAILLIFLTSFSIVVWNMRISKHVLDAFVFTNFSVVKEMKFQESKSNELYTTLESAVNASNAGKTYLEKAKEVKNASDSLCEYIVSIEKLMAFTTGQENCNPDSLNINDKANIDAPRKIMIEEKKGEEFKQKLNKYKEIVDPNTNSRGKEVINLFFNTDDPASVDNEPKTWEAEKFLYLPMITVFFELNQFRSSIRLLEAETMIYLQAMAANAINKEAVHKEERIDKKEKK